MLIPTYVCQSCTYVQDHQGETCPVCSALLVLTSDETRMIDVSVADDAELASRQVPVLDENGKPIMVESGSHYEQQFNPQTGQIDIVEVTDYTQKLRSLTDDEIAALQSERDQRESVLTPEVSQEAGPGAA